MLVVEERRFVDAPGFSGIVANDQVRGTKTALNGRRIAPNRVGVPCQNLVKMTQDLDTPISRMPDVGIFRDRSQRFPFALSTDEDWQPILEWQRVKLELARVVMGSVVRDRLAREQRPDNADGFVESV